MEIISLNDKRKEKETVSKILAITDAIDDLFLKAIYQDSLMPMDILPAIAHRLGYYCYMIQDGPEKERLTKFCQEIVGRIANKDKV